MVIINQALGQKGTQLLSYITPENVLFEQCVETTQHTLIYDPSIWFSLFNQTLGWN